MVEKLNCESHRILEADPGTGPLAMSYMLMLALALELHKQQSTMSAAVMVSLLNEVDEFKKIGWRYSPERRGPCRAARGAWSRCKAMGEEENAAFVAEAFTKLDGTYAWA